MKRLGIIMVLWITVICYPGSPLDANLKEWTEPLTGIVFMWIEGGCFAMGQSENEKRQILKEVNQYVYQDRFLNELPRHTVCVDGFWMGKYEVTNAQYRRWKSDYTSMNFKGRSFNEDNQPVVYMSWNDAKAFANWLSQQYRNNPSLPIKEGIKVQFRLPTEAEWEYACRAGTATTRYWGDDVNKTCQYANVADLSILDIWPDRSPLSCHDGYAVTATVGSFPPNEFGLYDMLGNVWEFCEDVYVGDIYGQRATATPIINPLTATGGKSPVRRGGGWFRNSSNTRCSARGFELATCVNPHIGFRLVRIAQ